MFSVLININTLPLFQLFRHATPSVPSDPTSAAGALTVYYSATQSYTYILGSVHPTRHWIVGCQLSGDNILQG